MDADLKAELELEEQQFQDTKQRRAGQWQRAVTLVAQRKNAAAAAGPTTARAPQPMDQP